jgi:GAF domain-containing protein
MPTIDDSASALLQATVERVQRMLQAGEPLRTVLAQLTQCVEAMSNGRSVASILLLDKDGLLRNGASPNLPADYLDAIDRLKPEPNLGTCAAAAATGEVVITTDFTTDGKWAELKHWPLSMGFKSAWSQPIKGQDGKVLGTLGTYFRECREPTAAERQLAQALAPLAANAVAASSAVAA